jgi:hypothetical protein
MGIFGFLKKPKEESMQAEMELPPLPSLDDTGFPRLGDELPPLPETSLPPLPTALPSMAALSGMPAMPKMELPSTPPPMTIIEPRKIEKAEQKFEFPTAPEMPSEEIIPDTVPPLDSLPEPPEFRTEMPRKEFSPKPTEMEDIPLYSAQEEPRTKTRGRGPLFIRSDNFKAIAEDIEQIRAKFKEEDDLFFRVTEVKNAQDQKYEAFRVALEDMQRKLLFIDRTLFENR